MKRVISFSLWGDNKVYTYGMIENVLLAKEIYPGWVVRVHYNDTVPLEIITWLKDQENTEMIHHSGDKKKASNMFWRIEDILSDWTVLVRDSDSRLNFREKAAVDEWLASNKDFHIMRDHPAHTVPIVGGGFGCRNNACKYIIISSNANNVNQCPFRFIETRTVLDNFIHVPESQDRYNLDQIFLYQHVYPTVVLNSIVHASHNKYEPFARDFPVIPYTGHICDIQTNTPHASKILGDPETNFVRQGHY